jgi:hypothetical protein
MAIQIETESNGLLNIRVSSFMSREDEKQCQEAIVKAIKLYGTVKGLVVMEAFQGWEKSTEWEDLLFYAEYENKVEKIAVIGDLKWHDDMFAFLSGPFRSGAVKLFNPSQESEARTWLSSPST